MREERFTARAIGAAVASAVLTATGLVVAAPLRGEGLGKPHDASVWGHKIDRLVDEGTWMIGALIVIFIVWMILALVLYGRKHKPLYDHGDSRSRIVAKCVVGAAIFFGIDGYLFYKSTVLLGETVWNWKVPENDPQVVRIEINAHQWAWDARYPGADGAFNTADDIVTLSDLVVPVNRPVTMQLAAVDVMHGLYIPHLRVKQDVLPGMLNRAWFEAKETGEFEMGCTQHCGTHHYKMRGIVRVVSEESYDAWAKHASALAERAHDPGDVEAHWGWRWRI